MVVLATFGQNYTMKPSGIFNLAKNILLFDRVSSFFEYKNDAMDKFWPKFWHILLKIA